MKSNYRHTRLACYSSYVVQGIINNLSPLLFVIFKEELGLSMVQLSLLITVNFSIQICVDLFSSFIVKLVGYRCCILAAQGFSTCGLLFLSFLSLVITNSFAALLISTVVMAIGGGLLEVLVSPIMEALPGDEKAASMSILHSFYCWGQVGVVALSTLFFAIFKTDNWRILPSLWALVPLITLIAFIFVPICRLRGDEAGNRRFISLATQKSFWLMLIVMLCAGAAEMAIAQWASVFCEIGLGVTKTLGDLLGPCAFAVFMGIGRLLFGKYKPKRVDIWISVSFAACLAAYLITAFAPHPIIALFGFALCGFSVSLLWPGTCSLGAERLACGGSLTFALFALGGDVGCVVGPDIIGMVSDAVEKNESSVFLSLFSGSAEEISMKAGILLASAIPALGLIISLILVKSKNRQMKQSLQEPL